MCLHLPALCFTKCSKPLSLGEAGCAVRTSGWLKLCLHLPMEMGSGMERLDKSRWKGTSMDGGMCAVGRAGAVGQLQSKAVLPSVFSLCSASHCKYLLCWIGQKLPTSVSQPFALYSKCKFCQKHQ